MVSKEKIYKFIDITFNNIWVIEEIENTTYVFGHKIKDSKVYRLTNGLEFFDFIVTGSKNDHPMTYGLYIASDKYLPGLRYEELDNGYINWISNNEDRIRKLIKEYEHTKSNI